MSSQPYPNPQAIFYQQYEAVRRDEVVGILLALSNTTVPSSRT